jgi:hypothetical protein
MKVKPEESHVLTMMRSFAYAQDDIRGFVRVMRKD